MKKFSRMQIVFLVLTLLVMVCIFLFSCENSDESSETSGNIVKIIINIFFRDFDSMTAYQKMEIYDKISHIIRKTAHFSVYTALGFCSSFTVGRKNAVKIMGVILFCFLYACSDELHQYFIPGRACMFTDVLIDTCGGITGLLISAVIVKITTKNAVPK